MNYFYEILDLMLFKTRSPTVVLDQHVDLMMADFISLNQSIREIRGSTLMGLEEHGIVPFDLLRFPTFPLIDMCYDF